MAPAASHQNLTDSSERIAAMGRPRVGWRKTWPTDAVSRNHRVDARRTLVRSNHAPDCPGYILLVHDPFGDGHHARGRILAALFRRQGSRPGTRHTPWESEAPAESSRQGRGNPAQWPRLFKAGPQRLSRNFALPPPPPARTELRFGWTGVGCQPKTVPMPGERPGPT